MPEQTLTLQQIKDRLRDPNGTIAEIAVEFGITRQALYERLRRAGIEIGPRKRSNGYDRDHPRELLTRLYEEDRLTVKEIAARLDDTPKRVSQALKGYGIRIRSSSESHRTHEIETMEVGDSFDVPAGPGKGKTYSNLYSRARTAGIRITIRRKDESTFTVTRVPVLRNKGSR